MTHPRSRIVFLAFATVFTLFDGAFSQTPVGKLDLNERVRISTPAAVTGDAGAALSGTVIHEGRVHEADSNMVVLRIGNEFFGTSFDRVDSLWVRGSASRTGALVGSVTAGLAAFTWLRSECDFSDAVCDTPEGTVLGLTLASVALGALTGAAVGSMIPKGWRLRYARGPATAEVGVEPALNGIAGRVNVEF